MRQAAVLGLAVLVLLCGADDPHWRSNAVLATFAACLAAGSVGAYLLFSREWRAAERAYGGS
jgi:hypothetical protein